MSKQTKRMLSSPAIPALILLLAPTMAGAQTTNLIFADGFESGDTSSWSVVRGDLGVNPGAAMGGSTFGLEVPGGSPSALTSLEPDRETTVLVQFLIDPNTFEIRRHARVDILRLYAQGRRHHLRLVLRQNAAGELGLHLAVRGNRGGYDPIGGSTLTPGEHFIELAWQTATSSNGNDGAAALFIDGDLAANAPNLANGRLDARAIRIGLLGSSVRATGGSFFLDEYQSFRTLSP